MEGIGGTSVAPMPSMDQDTGLQEVRADFFASQKMVREGIPPNGTPELAAPDQCFKADCLIAKGDGPDFFTCMYIFHFFEI